jgi:hypothetical protein
VDPRDLKRTIVRNSTQLAVYPYRRLDGRVRALLEAIIFGEKIAKCTRYSVPSLLKLFECYLCLAGRDCRLEDLGSTAFAATCSGFIGALVDPRFFGKSCQTSGRHAYIFRQSLTKLSLLIQRPIVPSDDREECASLWEATEISPSMVEYWSGWWVQCKHGKERFINLEPIWRLYGAKEARRMNDALGSYWGRLQRPSVMNSKTIFVEFFKFLAADSVYADALSDPESLSSAIYDFCEYFFLRCHANGLDLGTSIKRWNDWRVVVIAALVEPKVWPNPYPPIPAPPRSDRPGSQTHLRCLPNGDEVREKLLTVIPQHLTDDQAIEVLFGEVRCDVDCVVNWANEMAGDLYRRCENRKAVAETGVPIVGGNSHRTFAEIGLENISATFEMFGLEMFNPKRFHPKLGLSFARELEIGLGLPGSYDLEPFMYLLINEHPLITDAFLREFVVYDKYGHFVGFDKTDAGHTAVSIKLRRGARHAEQRVELTSRAEELIQEVLIITTPLRNHLRKIDDDDWRYLFLSLGKGLSKPSRVIGRFSVGQIKREKERLEQIARFTSKRDSELDGFLRRMTLTSFRASRGLIVFLEKKSVEDMSRALGHAKHRPGLLSHYLPEPLLQFFDSRWIRVFQANLICEAMKGSANLLKATDFHSMDDLHCFLKSHALGAIPDHLRGDIKGQNIELEANDYVFVNVGVGVLTALLSLRGAVESAKVNVNGWARYWSDFTRHLVLEIEKSVHDVTLIQNLHIARINANPCLYEEIICEAAA